MPWPNIAVGNGVTESARIMDNWLTSNLFQRIASAVAAAPIAIFAVWQGGWVFTLFLTAGAALMLWEWHRLWARAQGRQIWQVTVAPVLLGLAAVGAGWLLTALVLFMTAMWLGWIYVSRHQLSKMWVESGIVYVALPCAALIFLRNAETVGLWLVAYVFFVTWATDIGAYASGRTIGGPKIAPKISPNKTWAGLIGGVVAAAILSALMQDKVMAGDHSWVLVPIGAMLAVVAQVGDFFESWVKRRFGVKDSGRFLPGHGGILDRVDGIIPVATVLALLYAGGALWH